MLPTLDVLLEECGRLHGHLCPGQLLGVRMALIGCRLTGLSDPRGTDRKKLLVWVEIDRCMTDAVSAVTGARLGRRSLKFVDYGKVAATFLNTETGEAYRIVALESSRKLADARHLETPDRRQRQMLAYREAADEELFKIERVKVRLNEQDLPGRPRTRVVCVECGESVNDGREVRVPEPLCRACANESYYTNIPSASDNASEVLEQE